MKAVVRIAAAPLVTAGLWAAMFSSGWYSEPLTRIELLPLPPNPSDNLEAKPATPAKPYRPDHFCRKDDPHSLCDPLDRSANSPACHRLCL
jgi:hypothetical protein